MRRRALLAAVGLATATTGCIGQRPLAGTAEFTVDDPLENVHERGECGDATVVASAELADAADAPSDASAVVRYRDLDAPSRRVVRFHLRRGSAVACYGDDTLPFRRLLAETHTVENEYERRHDAQARAVYVRVSDSYHRLVEVTVYDQVYEP